MERKKREHRVDKSVEKCAGHLERLLDMKDVLYEVRHGQCTDGVYSYQC